MADVIKTGNYTKEDIRVSLKRKVQNAGLFSVELPVTDTIFEDSIVSHDFYNVGIDENIAYICGIAGAGEPTIIKYNTDLKTVIDDTFIINAGPGNPPDDGEMNGVSFLAKIHRNILFTWGNINISTGYIQMFEKDTGDYISRFGAVGAGDGEFTTDADFPDATFDSLDNIIITDEKADRIQYFNMGAFVNKVDVAASTLPSVACDSDGFIYVVDSFNSLIRKYDKDLAVVTTWAHAFGAGISTDDTYVYAADTSNSKVIRYSKTGTGATDVITGLTFGVESVAVDDNYVSVVDGAGTKIYNKSDFSLETTIALVGSGTALYNNQIYITDGPSGKVVRYDIDGTNVTDIITGLTTPQGIDIDDYGFIYVSFFTANTCKKYTIAGTLCVSWGGTGAGDGQFDNPRDLAWNPQTDSIIVVDVVNDRFQEFNYGKFIKKSGTFGVGNLNFDTPRGIAVDEDDNTYVVDYANDRVIKHDSSFTYIDEVAITNLTGIAINLTQERLYISTNPSSAGVIQIYDLDFVKYSTLPLKQDGFAINRDCTRIALSGFDLYCLEDDYIQKYNINNSYEGTWTDVTRFIDMSSDFEISYTSDETNFSLGKFDVGTLDLSIRNDNDKFAIETNTKSIFFDSLGMYQRNLSKIKIELRDTDVFEGYIDGKNVKYEQNILGLTLFANIQYLETIPLQNFAGVIFDGDSTSDIIEKLINNLYVKDFVSYTAADIKMFRDVDIDDVSALPDFILETIELFSDFGKFSFGIYNGENFYTYSSIGDAGDGSTNLLDARTLDYIITQNNLLGKTEFNTGEHRLFRTVVVTGNGVTGNYEIAPNVFNIYNEDREISISSNSITTQATVDNIAADYEWLSVYPSKEITHPIPLQLPSDGKIFDKQFAYNIFDADGDRGLNINDPALTLGNTILPTKETALDDNDSGLRVLYRILGWKQIIGSEMITEIKNKEMITDDAP